MFIEKYTVQVKNLYNNKIKKVLVNANTALEAHKLALDYTNELTQDITKIVDSEKNIVYTLDNGFVEYKS